MEYSGSWSVNGDSGGLKKMESGIDGRAIDFAKLGRLMLNRGQWNGAQIVSSGWVDASPVLNQNFEWPRRELWPCRRDAPQCARKEAFRPLVGESGNRCTW